MGHYAEDDAKSDEIQRQAQLAAREFMARLAPLCFENDPESVFDAAADAVADWDGAKLLALWGEMAPAKSNFWNLQAAE